jgi:hypothetical protein
MASGRCQSAGNTPCRSARSLNSHALSPPIHSPILLNSLGFAQNLCVLCVSKKQSSRAVVSPFHGEAPAEPHPCHERCTAPCRSTKTPTLAHNADQNSMARQMPRPAPFPVLQFRPVRPALPARDKIPGNQQKHALRPVSSGWRSFSLICVNPLFCFCCTQKNLQRLEKPRANRLTLTYPPVSLNRTGLGWEAARASETCRRQVL